MIAEAAYYKAQKHGFDPSFDAQNWQDACLEIDAMLAQQGKDTGHT